MLHVEEIEYPRLLISLWNGDTLRFVVGLDCGY
jgi:hypothetical protein